jgi:type IX secretion system PorP/SprF family membrane protein
VTLILFFGVQVNGQDFHFTQFYANKLYLAPSFAGATQQNRLILNYRNQWPAVNGYVTYSASFDHYFSNFNSGLGLLVMRDVAGDGKLGPLSLSLNYSYDFPVTEEIHLRPGLAISYLQWSVDFSKFNFSNQIDQTSTSQNSITDLSGKASVGSIDGTSSVIVYAKNWMFGTTFDHLLSPNKSLLGNEDKLPLEYAMYGSVTLFRYGRLLKPVDETVTVAGIFRGMGKDVQLDVGLYWAQIPLTFGLWYRGIPIVNSDRGDSFAFMAGIKRQHFTIGYSYDFTISNLVNKTAGAHEISMAFEFSKEKRKKMHAVPCPEF